ncbi:hypothetical protein PAHAL_3G073100 [Panicum hallii]|uniref:Gnk2-homologous domain-containing protein n=1 Tax=Panicum hallii TaxID=206008 RepID=A0A2T8KHE2_9POAL|nr:hypothetical protein PAHAL_3G073100 [Panicum hallii]
MAVTTTAMPMRFHRRLPYVLFATAPVLLVFLHVPLAAAMAGRNNASSYPALFATGATGAAPDDVYALALCRGDTNASSCASCVAKAFDDAQQLCALNRGVTVYDDPCVLRYADWDFLTNATDNRGVMVAWNFDNVSASAAAAFDAASRRLVNATSEYAAADPARRFGTGEVWFDETYPKIYSLAQCTPDMAAADCRTCLGGIYVGKNRSFSFKLIRR